MMLHEADESVSSLRKRFTHRANIQGRLFCDEALQLRAPLALEFVRLLPIAGVDRGLHPIGEFEQRVERGRHGYALAADAIPSQPSLISRNSEPTSFRRSPRFSSCARSSVRDT